jgi:purine-binding chemotaxis protein CheW
VKRDLIDHAKAQPDGEQKTHYLTFFIAGEEYGVPLMRVRQIIEFDTVTRVPSAPACVRGVINLRGRVVPVADLAIQFRQPECVITKQTCVVVVEVAVHEELLVMGLLVDSVHETAEFGPEDIAETPAFGTLARPDYLTGMGRSGKKFVLLLDLDRVLSGEELARAVPTEPPGEQPRAQ